MEEGGVLYSDEKHLPCIDVARNQIPKVTREGYTMKMWYGLASKNAVEQRRQEGPSLEQV